MITSNLYSNISQYNLIDLANARSTEYKNAKPFRHIAIDNFFNEEFINQVYDEFPNLEDIPDIINGNNGVTDIKLMTKRGDKQLSPLGKLLIWYLNSHEFIDFLETLTGINAAIIPDPHLIGGGMHEIKSSGFLKIHTDYMFHHETKLDRRLNVIVYLNKDWKHEYGGELQLWDPQMKSCQARIFPVFNRIVIFETSSFTYHGVPDPIDCPKDISRRSFALYYYSNGRPKSEIKSVESRTTKFINRPGEIMKPKKDIRYWVHQVTPPFIIDVSRNIINFFHRSL